MRNIEVNCLIMSNSCNEPLTLSNTAEIVENERPVHLTPLQWSNSQQ